MSEQQHTQSQWKRLTGTVKDVRSNVTNNGTSVVNFKLEEETGRRGAGGGFVPTGKATWYVEAWKVLADNVTNSNIEEGAIITIEGWHKPDREYTVDGVEKLARRQFNAQHIYVDLADYSIGGPLIATEAPSFKQPEPGIEMGIGF